MAHLPSAAGTLSKAATLSAIRTIRKVNRRVFSSSCYAAAELEQIAGLIRFDRDFYLTEYPDVAVAGMDPLRHFLDHGVDEMRLPASPNGAPVGDWLEHSLGFDPALYAARYPETAAAPREHFIRFGAREHRLPFNLDDNLASEQLLMEVLAKIELPYSHALEAPAQYEADRWRALPEALLAHAQQKGAAPKPYRNNFWLGMAIGLLAEGRFGAVVCCYSFFFNYYIPTLFFGNAADVMIGAGHIVGTVERIANSGTVMAAPRLARSVTVPEPTFLNRPNRNLPAPQLELPTPVYGILHDVEAIGGTSLMVQDGHVVLYDYVEYGKRARELQSPNLLHIVGQNCSFRLPSRTMEVDEAFSMLHDHGNNYHHWLLEVVPRWLLARRNGLPDGVPLLVEGDIAPQMREVLGEACQAEPALIEVARGASVQVKKLHFVSDLCVNSVHTGHPPEHGDILFSPSAVEMLRALASPYFLEVSGKYDKVLIVRQNVGFRRLVNQGVLLEAMRLLGMWCFDPGTANWVEQVRVFSNARLIVAEAGAALANLVFCRPGASVIVLVNGHANSNFFYLTQLARLVGARLYFFECLRLARSHPIEVQDDMIVPVNQLADWVRRFLADPKSRPFETTEPCPSSRPRHSGARAEPASRNP